MAGTNYIFLLKINPIAPLGSYSVNEIIYDLKLSEDGRTFAVFTESYKIMFFKNVYQPPSIIPPDLTGIYILIGLLIGIVVVASVSGYILNNKRKKYKIKISVVYTKEDKDKFNIVKISKELSEKTEIEEVIYRDLDQEIDILEYLNETIDKCQLFIVVCTENSLDNIDVEMEWMSALKRKKKFIPLFTDPKFIPPLLSTKLGFEYNPEDLISTAQGIYNLVLKKLQVKPKDKKSKEKR